MDRLISFGDSWTEGEGSDLKKEELLSSDELTKFRNNNSWPIKLANKLGIPKTINYGISGNSNIKIFNKITKMIEDGDITNSDFVCVMFSSSLRDEVPFLPNNDWISWSVKHFINKPDKFIKSYDSMSDDFNLFLSDYKRFFVTNLFSQNYFNIINQNYIIFLQKLFNHYGIKYIMCDGLESMLEYVDDSYNKIELIDTDKYFGEGTKSFRKFLSELNKSEVWEGNTNVLNPETHPSNIGYSIIADELYKFINKNNIL